MQKLNLIREMRDTTPTMFLRGEINRKLAIRKRHIQSVCVKDNLQHLTSYPLSTPLTATIKTSVNLSTTSTTSMVQRLAYSPRLRQIVVTTSLGQVKPMKIKLIFAASSLRTPYVLMGKRRVNAGWFRIKIICSSGVTCLRVDCCFSELALLRFN